MSKFYHISQGIKGPLVMWKTKDWKQATKYITHDDGSKYTPDQLKAEFVRLLADGYHVIPTCECDNFDKVKGCQGHEEQSDALAKARGEGEK